MLDTNKILYELLTEEFLRPIIGETLFYDDSESLEKVCDNFSYTHDLSSIKMHEDLSDDFETSGTIEYNVNTKTGLLLTATFNYCDGGLDDIEYSIKNKDLFESFLNYATEVVNIKLRDRMIANI